MSLVIAHKECIINGGCDSTDAMSIYENGLQCFSCGGTYFYRKGEAYQDYLDGKEPSSLILRERVNTMKPKDGLVVPKNGLPDRGISKNTLNKYGVGVTLTSDRKIKEHYYPYYNTDKELTAYKIRRVKDKGFLCKGSIQDTTLFGQSLFTPNDKLSVTITEGELDAMAVYQMQGSKYPVVSLKGGSDLSIFENENVYKWLLGFKKIVLCMDNDKVGKEAEEKIRKILPPYMVKTFTHKNGLKDACDYLRTGKVDMFMNGWYNAQEYVPEAFISSDKLKDRLKNFKYEMGEPYPFDSWNDKTYGLRTKETVVIAARPAAGKTSVMRQMIHSILSNNLESKVGAIFLEEDTERLGLGLMSIDMMKPMHRPNTEWTDEEFDDAWNKTLGSGRLIVHDKHDGYIDMQDLENSIRYFARGLGIKYIFLDPFGRISANGVKSGRETSEEVSKRISQLCVELDVCVIVAIHLNRDMALLGSDALLRDANVIFSFDKQEDEETGDRITVVSVTKNRLYGIEGKCPPLMMDRTGSVLEESDEASALEMLLEEDNKKNKKKGYKHGS